MQKFPTLASIAIVLKDEEVLLVRRKNEPDAGVWGFPGGHVELGETALAAAARELHEETSIAGKPIMYLTNVDVIERNNQGQIDFHFLMAAVLCEYISGNPEAADDVAEARWWPVEDILNNRIGTSDGVNVVLRLAIDPALY